MPVPFCSQQFGCHRKWGLNLERKLPACRPAYFVYDFLRVHGKLPILTGHRHRRGFGMEALICGMYVTRPPPN